MRRVASAYLRHERFEGRTALSGRSKSRGWRHSHYISKLIGELWCIAGRRWSWALKRGGMQAFLPLLGTDRSLTGPPGKVVNITSIMSRKTIPFISGYCASKHALEALTDAMRREFCVYGIKVVNVAPGKGP